MPTYDFYCADCRDRFEMFTSFTASAGVNTCPRCQGSHVRKLYSVFATSGRGSDAGDYSDFSEESGHGGGCSCGGACSCGGH